MQDLLARPYSLLIYVLTLALGVSVAQEFVCYERNEDHMQAQFIGSSTTYSRDEVPWMVNLSFGGTPFCGGSLINDSTVLTAAHCVRPGMTVRRADAAGTPYGEALRVERYAVHPDYDTTRNVSGSDIALLRLDGRFDVSLAELPRLLSPAHADTWGVAGDCAWAKGWGVTVEGSRESSPILLGADLPIWSDQACRASYGSTFFVGSMCAGYEEGKIGSCQGDSGGPLLVRGGPTGIIQVGIVSFGLGCARANYPTVYVRVSSFYDWIFQTAESFAQR